MPFNGGGKTTKFESGSKFSKFYCIPEMAFLLKNQKRDTAFSKISQLDEARNNLYSEFRKLDQSEVRCANASTTHNSEDIQSETNNAQEILENDDFIVRKIITQGKSTL